MRKHFCCFIVLGLCACSTTAPVTPSVPATKSTTAPTSRTAAAPTSSAAAPPDATATGNASAPPTTGTAGTAPSSSGAAASVSGSVWRDVCDSGGEGQPAPSTPPPGCVPGAAGGFVADGIRAANEPPIARVHVTLGTGACPGAPTSSTATDGQGHWTFPDLLPGTYCVAVNALDNANLPLLLPGRWTAPAAVRDNPAASVTVPLAANEQRTDITFGWDYQLAP